MKKESLQKLFALVAAAGILGSVPVQADHHEKGKGPANLEEAMDEMSGALKSLRRLKRDPDKWNKSAAKVAEGAKACIAAMSMVPKQVAQMPAGPAKTKALADVRRLMGLTLAGYAELELAFLAKDQEKVDAAMEKLKELKATGHEAYNKDE